MSEIIKRAFRAQKSIPQEIRTKKRISLVCRPGHLQTVGTAK